MAAPTRNELAQMITDFFFDNDPEVYEEEFDVEPNMTPEEYCYLIHTEFLDNEYDTDSLIKDFEERWEDDELYDEPDTPYAIQVKEILEALKEYRDERF